MNIKRSIEVDEPQGIDVGPIARGDSDNGKITKEEQLIGGSFGEAPPDPFDPQSFRTSQDFGAGLHVKERLLKVPLRNMPAKEWWFRVHPDPGYQVIAPLLELKEDRELYLVQSDLVPLVSDEPTYKEKLIATAVNRDEAVFLLHLRYPGIDGKRDDWMDTALEACKEARDRWVRVFAGTGYYRLQFTEAELSEPKWPDMSFRELLRLAFKDRLIDSVDHPVLQRLRGEK